MTYRKKLKKVLLIRAYFPASIFLNKPKLIIAVNNSAMATVIHTPPVPNRRSNRIIPQIIKTNPLHAEITGDHFALSRAVKKLALEILKPFNRIDETIMIIAKRGCPSVLSIESKNIMQRLAPIKGINPWI